ncbi:MAG TPA: hypothetical protein VND41_03080 [Nitrososphaerales archaeon]|nr:hypothetical protein [Nitrososphaerales archaeon]
MKLRQFVEIMGVVALVAVIYSPSSIGFSASPGGDGGTAPTDTSSSGTSMFLSYLHQSGYHVTVANTTQEAAARLGGLQKLVYVLIGADTALTSSEVRNFRSGYDAGIFSALIAEGNSTNKELLATLGANASGRAIVDQSSLFQDQQVFTVDLSLLAPGAFSLTNATGVIDVASPLLLDSSSPLSPAATTSPQAYDLLNSTLGPRTVVAAGTGPSGARAVVLTDSAPFTNFLFNYTQGTVDERAFVAAMLSYVDPGKATPILLDASQYTSAQPPKFQAGIPVGPLVAYFIEQNLAGLNSYYASYPSQVSGFLGGYGIHVSPGLASALVALILLLSVYGALTRWFAPEKKGKDDQPQPSVERTIVAESRARIDFLQTSRSKGGYVATLAQLYEVLDSIVAGEFGVGVSSVEERVLAEKIGADEARRAKKLFLELSKFHDYASGERRFLFPPVLRWRALTARTTQDAEAFLNRLGITIAGEDEPSGQRMEHLMRERVRA